MERFLALFIERKRATILFLIIATLLGYAAYTKIPRESNPDIKIPTIYVLMKYQGVSPEDGQSLLLHPMENALRSLEGITKMTAYAKEGSANIVLEFKAGLDTEKILKNVRDKVNDAKHKLPKNAEAPIIKEVNLSLEPVLNVIITGEQVPENTLLHLARKLKEATESVEGVLEVIIGGEKKDALEIIIAPELIEGYGLSVALLNAVIANGNKVVTAGTLQSPGGAFAIKVPTLIKNLEELLAFPIKADQHGVLRLGDIATIKKTFKDPETIARVNGKPAIVLEVSKRSGANIINTVKAVKNAVQGASQGWPDSVKILYSQDQSDQIEEMVSDLENSIILAGIFVLILIILSFGIKSALLIAFSLPSSFFIGILILACVGFTLNIVVLFSLILTVGMIVDDAIVVSEYADRQMTLGHNATQSFLEAATRMFWPILTSTLVKIVVFLPLLFWPGVIGQFMHYMPITVIIILTNSLLFALIFQPAIGSLFSASKHIHSHNTKSTKLIEDEDLSELKGLTAKYISILSAVIKRPKLFIVSVFSLLISVYTFFFIAGTGIEFFPQIEPSTATITIGSPGNLSLQQRDDILKEVEARILDMTQDIKIFYAKSGAVDTREMFPEDTIATIQLEFEDWQKRNKASKILQIIQERLGTVEGINFQILQKRKGPPSQKPIEINFITQDYQLLPPFIAKLRAALDKIGGLQDIEDSRPVPAIEWHLLLDRDLAAQYQINTDTIGNTIQLVTTGLKISSYRPNDSDDEVDILLRYPIERRTLSELDNIMIVTTTGQQVPIGNLIKRVPATLLDKIKRVNQKITITLKSNVKAGVLVDNKVKEIKQWLANNLEPGIEVLYAGDDKEQKESGKFLVSAFLLALLLMFMIMLVQFNSFYHTFVVMSAVFLSTVGVLIGLLISWQPFGVVMCGIGVIALSGVVLSNNIIFIDTYQYLRAQGFSIEKAVLQTGAQRARPIVLTATAAILGLIPMVFGLTINMFDREITYNAPSSQWWRQLSASIAGGLSFATILTLFFTPCLLLLGRRFEHRKNK